MLQLATLVAVHAQPKRQPLPPALHTLSDAAEALSVPEGRALADLLYEIERRTRTKIIVLILPKVAPESIEDYTRRLAIHWRNKGRIREGGRFVFVVIAQEDRVMHVLPSRGLAWLIEPLEQSDGMQDARGMFAENKYYEALTLIVRTLFRLLTERTI